MNASAIYRMTAFSNHPEGGNPAGVWLGESLPDSPQMQRIAADIGYSETAFIAPCHGRSRQVRYFSPLTEVPFCGHATIASGVLLGRLQGLARYDFHTRAGLVPVQVQQEADRVTATLISVPTRHRPIARPRLHAVLAALRWSMSDLDLSIPPALAYAGAWHLVLAANSRDRLSRLDYAFDALKALMLELDLTTVQLLWRESECVFHSRNPFPVGGVVEDAATGASAAALGGYLRDAGLQSVPMNLVIHQGHDMGRPSVLEISVHPTGGVEVSGSAVQLS